MKTCALILCLSIPAFAQDAGTLAPYFAFEPAGTTLQLDAYAATPETVQKFDIDFRTAQSDAASGAQKATLVGLILGVIGLVLGALIGGGAVAAVKK